VSPLTQGLNYRSACDAVISRMILRAWPISCLISAALHRMCTELLGMQPHTVLIVIRFKVPVIYVSRNDRRKVKSYFESVSDIYIWFIYIIRVSARKCSVRYLYLQHIYWRKMFRWGGTGGLWRSISFYCEKLLVGAATWRVWSLNAVPSSSHFSQRYQLNFAYHVMGCPM